MGLDMYMHCNDREFVHEVQDKEWRARRSQIMYWRKANAIHRWFTEEAEYCEGFVNGGEIEVTISDIERLHCVCREVLEDHDKAPKLLPTESGFFWGSLEYDEYYFENIRYTHDTLGRILDLISPAKVLEVAEGEFAGITWDGDYIYKHNDWIIEFRYSANW